MESEGRPSSTHSTRSRANSVPPTTDRVLSSIPRLKSTFADSERTRWEKLSSSKAFTASSPPYLSPTVDPKLLETANLHCSNKASMLRIQHCAQNAVQPNADINRTVKKNKNHELKSKILTASIILSSDSEMSHGFLLGSRYNSIRTIDTNPLKIGGVCVPRNGNAKCFIGTNNNSHYVRRASSAPQSRTPSRAKIRGIPSRMLYHHEPLRIQGIAALHGENEPTHSPEFDQRLLSLPSPPPNSIISDSTTRGSVTTSRGSRPTSSVANRATVKPKLAAEFLQKSPQHDKEASPKEEESDSESFWEENENDLLSPEAQKLTSQILMSFSRSSLSSRTISQVSVTPQGSVVEDDSCAEVLKRADDDTNNGLCKDDHNGSEGNSAEETTRTKSLVVDMSHLTVESDPVEKS